MTKLIIILLALGLLACEARSTGVEVSEGNNLITYESLSNRHVAQIVFAKEPKTGLCFAYMWGGGWRGGPALANVPCESLKDLGTLPVLRVKR